MKAFITKISKETGISVSLLKQVYARGLAAWKTGHRPGTTPHQWARARVYSFVQGGKTTEQADRDLAIRAGIRSKFDNPKTPKGRKVPARYVKGISKRAQKDMLLEIDAFAEADPSYAEAYKTWRGDLDDQGRRWETQKSKYTLAYRANPPLSHKCVCGAKATKSIETEEGTKHYFCTPHYRAVQKKLGGPIKSSKARSTGTQIELWPNEDTGDPDNPYMLICNDHSGVVGIHSIAAGTKFMSAPEMWCPGCQGQGE